MTPPARDHAASPAAGPAAAAADELEQLRQVLTQMPITQFMGVEVVAADATGVHLAAPLAVNVNPRGAGFAGSLNTIATLAGYALLFLLLRRHGVAAQVVIQDSSVQYLRPVTGDFHAIGDAPPPDAERNLLTALRRRGRGRITLEVVVSDGNGPAVRFTGRYVAQNG